ncbi:MAG TPA: transposase [Chloroflexota bacterium]|nr:transposase [Chloroflexota bacterium]
MSHEELPRRKRIRLDADAYAESDAVCSVTIAVKDRQAIFSNPVVAAAAVDVLLGVANEQSVKVFAYCIMPDHIHLVLSPSGSCDIITFVARFKNLTQRAAWKLGVQGAFWQARFWDHFIRRDEGVVRAVQYVLDNPVRKNLVSRWQDYPLAGSLVFDLV